MWDTPFSLEKITWNETTRTVLYRSKRNWRTKRNFEVFSATDFLAAAVEHIPPKNQQTIRRRWSRSTPRRTSAGATRAARGNRGTNGPKTNPPGKPRNSRSMTGRVLVLDGDPLPEDWD